MANPFDQFGTKQAPGPAVQQQPGPVQITVPLGTSPPSAGVTSPPAAAPVAPVANPFDQYGTKQAPGPVVDPTAPKPIPARSPMEVASNFGKEVGPGVITGIPHGIEYAMDLASQLNPITGTIGAVNDLVGRFTGRGDSGADPATRMMTHPGEVGAGLLDKVGLSPEKAFPEPATAEGRIGRMTGEGISQAIPMLFGDEAGAPGLVRNLGRIGREVFAGGLGGAGSQTAVEGVNSTVPEYLQPYLDPIAGFIGGAAGGAGGYGLAGAGAAAPGAARAAYETLVPNRANAELRAARKLSGVMTDPASARAKIDASEPTFSGARQTAVQATGDRGLAQYEAARARSNPEFNDQLLAQQAAQRQKQMQALDQLQQTGSGAAAAEVFRGRMDDLEQRADDIYQQAQQHAQQERDNLGTPNAGSVGSAARLAIADNFKKVQDAKNALYDTVDPDGRMHVETKPLVEAAHGIYGEMSPEGKLSLSPAEKGIASIISTYGDTLPFRRFRSLTSEIGRAMREAKGGQQPNDLAYGRLSQLRSAVEAVMDKSIESKAETERAAVEAGTMRPEDTTAENFLRQAQEWTDGSNQQAGRSAATGDGVPPGAQTSAVSGNSGAAGEAGRGPRGVPGDQGLPENARVASPEERLANDPEYQRLKEQDAQLGRNENLGRPGEDPAIMRGAVRNRMMAIRAKHTKAFEQERANGQGTDGTGGVRPAPGSATPAEGNGGRNAPQREPDGSLAGLPRKPGPGITASGFPRAQEVARRYMEKAGLEYNPPNTYAKVVPERAARIADAYDQMQHAPQDPAVKAAYDQMLKETMGQYQAMVDDGLKIEFIKPGQEDPYHGNPRNMTEDVRNNNHMWVFSTKDGFGSDARFDPSQNPLLGDSGVKFGDQPATYNDVFRAVHDYFGHVKEGVGFRADGEENAWRAHSAMYSPEARKAMTSETRGQNSWVNYGPYGEANRTARSEDTHYADQKIGILPDWAIHEGAGDQTPANTLAERLASAGRPDEQARSTAAIADATYNAFAAAAGMTPEEFARRYPLSEVQKTDVAPEGSLHQSQYNDEYHPATAFMDMADAHPDRMGPRKIDISNILKSAFEASGRNANDIPLIIDNDRDLEQRAKQAVKEASPSITDEDFDSNGGVGQTFMDVVKAYAPSEEEWNKEFGRGTAQNLPAVYHEPTAPVFYSQATRALDTVKGDKMPPDQWWNVFFKKNPDGTISSKLPGVRKEELDFMGLEPWLMDWPVRQNGPITKEDVANFLRRSELSVEDVTLRSQQGERFRRQYYDREDFPGGDVDQFNPVIRQGEFQPEDPDYDYLAERADDMVKDQDFRDQHLPDALDKALSEYESRVESVGVMPPGFMQQLKDLIDGPQEDVTPALHPDIFGGETPIVPPPPPVDPRLLAAKEQIEKDAEDYLHNKAQEQAEEDWNNDGDIPGTRDVSVRVHDNADREYYTYHYEFGGQGGTITGPGLSYGDLEWGHRDDPDDVLAQHLQEQWDNEDHGDPEERQRHEDEQDRLEAEHNAEQDHLQQEFDAAQRNRPQERVIPNGDPRFNGFKAPGGTNYTELLLRLPDTGKSQKDRFTESHWPAHPDVVAHVRFDTRTVGGKRTLFIQEAQSDWHQKGQERGYKTADDEAKHKAAQEALQAATDKVQELLDKSAQERSGGKHINVDEHLQALDQDLRDKANKFVQARDEYYRVNRPSTPPADIEVAKEALGLARTAHEDAQNLRDASRQHFNQLRYNSPEGIARNEAERDVVNARPGNKIQNGPFKDTGWRELVLKRMLRWAAEHGYEQIAWTPGDLQNGGLVTQKVHQVIYDKNPDGTYNIESRNKGGHYVEAGSDSGIKLEDVAKRYGKDVADQIERGEGTAEGFNGRRKAIDLPNGPRVGGDIQEFYGRSLPSLMKKIIKKFDGEVTSTPMKLMNEDINAVTVPINEKMRDAALNNGFPLFQKGDSGPRGAINFGENFKTLISMLQHADASTGVHELSHQFLEIFRDLQGREGVSPKLKADWEAVKNWWADNAVHVAADAGHDVTPAQVQKAIREGTSGNTEIDAHINRGLHEQWARGFESYLRDGVAPTPALKRAFENFKQWLTQIYRSVTGLNVNLSPEMKGVFSRMLGGTGEEHLPKPAAAGPEMLTPEARTNLKQANAANTEMRSTFKDKSAKPVPEIMASKGPTYGYDMPDEQVVPKLWRPGAEGASAIKNVLKAANGHPDAVSSIESAAVMSLREAATDPKTGTIDPVKLEAWKNKHAAALAEMPGLNGRFDRAASATKTMKDVDIRRNKLLKEARSTAVGKLLGLTDDQSVSRTIGSMLGSKTAVQSMSELARAAANDPVALDGLRRAVIEHMTEKLRVNDGGMGDASFTKYFGKNAPALAKVLSREQMNSMRSLSQEVRRNSVHTKAPGGGSDTAQNLAAKSVYGLGGTLLGRLFGNAAATVAGSGIGAAIHPFVGIATALGGIAVSALREVGIHNTEGVINEALADPQFFKTLLAKAPKKPGTGSEHAVVRQAKRIALGGAKSLYLGSAMARAQERKQKQKEGVQ